MADRLEGFIDQLSPDGFFDGWARRLDSDDPVIVEIRHNQQTVAKAVADQFRRDLLTAKFHHGHHAFRARLTRDIGAGIVQLTLHNAATGDVIPPRTNFDIATPPDLERKTFLRVEDLLNKTAIWTDEDVLNNLGSLRLAEVSAKLGPACYVSRCYLYLLGRPPDATGLLSYLQGMVANEITPAQVFESLLTSEERKNRTANLSAPREYDYPWNGVTFD